VGDVQVVYEKMFSLIMGGVLFFLLTLCTFLPLTLCTFLSLYTSRGLRKYVCMSWHAWEAKGKIGKTKITDKEFIREIVLGNLVIMRFLCYFVQRKSLNKSVFKSPCHHAASILPLVPKERAMRRVSHNLGHLRFH
jgi:hypothetical protein